MVAIAQAKKKVLELIAIPQLICNTCLSCYSPECSTNWPSLVLWRKKEAQRDKVVSWRPRSRLEAVPMLSWPNPAALSAGTLVLTGHHKQTKSFSRQCASPSAVTQCVSPSYTCVFPCFLRLEEQGKKNPFNFQDEKLEHCSKISAGRNVYPSVTFPCFL